MHGLLKLESLGRHLLDDDGLPDESREGLLLLTAENLLDLPGPGSVRASVRISFSNFALSLSMWSL